jgi:hypothetical protein
MIPRTIMRTTDLDMTQRLRARGGEINRLEGHYTFFVHRRCSLGLDAGLSRYADIGPARRRNQLTDLHDAGLAVLRVALYIVCHRPDARSDRMPTALPLCAA